MPTSRRTATTPRAPDTPIETLKARIEQQAHASTLATEDFRRLLKHTAADIRAACSAAANEAGVASAMELRLYSLVKDLFKRELTLEKEALVATARHTAKGRVDSRLGALVIEYKQPSKLKAAADQAAALAQLENYLTHLPCAPGQRLTGMLTDGTRAQLVFYENGEFVGRERLTPLSEDHLEQFVRHALSLDRTALSPQNLVKDFCGASDAVAVRLAKALFDALSGSSTQRTDMLFQEWQALFRLAHDDVTKQQPILERKQALAGVFDHDIAPGDNETEYRALFALQTAFAIIVKVIALKVISAVRTGSEDVKFSAVASLPVEALQSKMARLEDGDIFREMGLTNLLEGDFFAWYCTAEQWNPAIGEAVMAVFNVLAGYEEQPIFKPISGKAGDAQDFFKDLYMHVIPDKVRHSLGEYYTPPWLASQVVAKALAFTQVPAPATPTFLDPCCGSGTFLSAFLREVMTRCQHLPRHEQLAVVLRSVKGIDLNPLAVLTARINYFINIASLIDEEQAFEIPVYLGDASYVPSYVERHGVTYVTYQLQTVLEKLTINLPRSTLRDVSAFSRAMTRLEQHIRNEDAAAIVEELWCLARDVDGPHEEAVRVELRQLADSLVDLQKRNWNGIWARILTNFLTTANLGRFDVIAGNPPWVDWKNLPQGYRERIKGLCIERSLFSGDAIVGGINLNICALITSVAADNWLAPDGILAFLMPEPLLFQQSYEGFRRLKMGPRTLYFQALDNWSRAGHPFAPVTQKFLTYFIAAKEQDYRAGIPVDTFVRKRARRAGLGLVEHAREVDFAKVAPLFDVETTLAVQSSQSRTAFTYAAPGRAEQFRAVAGSMAYRGRQGCELYPQELFLLRPTGKRAPAGKVHVVNVQMDRSTHRIAQQERLVEADFLHPLIRGTDIGRFSLRPSGWVVPFPYHEGARSPLSVAELARTSPLLLRYLQDHKSTLESQTTYNKKIIGEKHAGEFYQIMRVGQYTYAPHFVAFRDNTTWGAVVVSTLQTPWGVEARPVFQKHAGTVSVRPDGAFISEDEAHYICAVLNAPVVRDFIESGSDTRSFKLQIPVRLPLFDALNPDHLRLCALSRQAHRDVEDAEVMQRLDAALDAACMAVMRSVDGTEAS